MARKKSPWQIGDKVRLIEGKEYLRTGYPMHLPAVIADIDENQTELLRKVLAAAGFPPRFQNRRVIREYTKAIAYGLIYQQEFGGRRRDIHEGDLPDFLHGKTFTIVGKFGTMTGEYYPPGGEYDDYEPGGLADQKYETILDLKWDNPTGWWSLPDNPNRSRKRGEEFNLYVWSKRVINLSRPETPTQIESPPEIDETED